MIVSDASNSFSGSGRMVSVKDFHYKYGIFVLIKQTFTRKEYIHNSMFHYDVALVTTKTIHFQRMNESSNVQFTSTALLIHVKTAGGELAQLSRNLLKVNKK